MEKLEIVTAYNRIRENDNVIPDDVLDFMKNSALERIEFIKNQNEFGNISEEDYRAAKNITDTYEELKREKREKKLEKMKDEILEYLQQDRKVTDIKLEKMMFGICITIYTPNHFNSYIEDEVNEKVEKIGNKYNEKVFFPSWYFPK